MEKILLILSLIVPLISGALVAFIPSLNKTRRVRNSFVGLSLLTELALCIILVNFGDTSLFLFSLNENLPIALKTDSLGLIFANVIALIWTVAGFFSFKYMSHERDEREYFSFYMLTLSALISLAFSASLVTMYLFFELVTLLSLAFVVHQRTKEAIAGTMKYLIYSIAGATVGLLAIFFLSKNTTSPYFIAGGSLKADLSVDANTLLAILFVSIVGFATKAGMFPMHGWLPSAHPVAPSPASAVLSGVITKAGVLCVIRIIYYSVGTEFLLGTWVQNALIILALLTIFMGSVMALNEKHLKKRLAYSSVSQLSYILVGVFLMTRESLLGALLHLVAHAIIKSGLFMTAGAFIYKTGAVNVEDLRGIGKRMPLVTSAFALLSLGLIGIPPSAGFISKWYLAQGAIVGGGYLVSFSYLVPLVLLASALLTAGYLLPPVISAFFQTESQGFDISCADEKTKMFFITCLFLAVLCVLIGLYPKPLTDLFGAISNLLIKGM